MVKKRPRFLTQQGFAAAPCWFLGLIWVSFQKITHLDLCHTTRLGLKLTWDLRKFCINEPPSIGVTMGLMDSIFKCKASLDWAFSYFNKKKTRDAICLQSASFAAKLMNCQVLSSTFGCCARRIINTIKNIIEGEPTNTAPERKSKGPFLHTHTVLWEDLPRQVGSKMNVFHSQHHYTPSLTANEIYVP